jgi:transposase
MSEVRLHDPYGARRDLSQKSRASLSDIAWKAQTRLCTRYRTLIAKGKKPTVTVTAIAREMAAFIWAIVREVQLAQVPA